MNPKISSLFNIIIQIIVIYFINYKFGNNLIKYKKNTSDLLSRESKNFFTDIIIDGYITPSGKIDIIMANHFSSFDFVIINLLIHKYDKFYVLYKNSLKYVPFMSSLLTDSISLHRNWELDKEPIIQKINNYDNCLIILFPEGTRYTPKLFRESRTFCYNNKFPLFNNLLAPRTKGIYLIINHLKNNNKLGNIYDVSIINKHMKEKMNMYKIINYDLGKILFKINKINVNNFNFDNYDKFKKSFFYYWLKKDNDIKQTQNL
jgi:1-acyl-sn-glycerol-3-phosphate acyltransferase